MSALEQHHHHHQQQQQNNVKGSRDDLDKLVSVPSHHHAAAHHQDSLYYEHHHQQQRSAAKGSRDDLNKLAAAAAASQHHQDSLYFEQREREKLTSAKPPDHYREQQHERMLHLLDRGTAVAALHAERTGVKGQPRMPLYSSASNMHHELTQQHYEQQQLYHCKLCAKKFKSKHLFEVHVCSGDSIHPAEKHSSHAPYPGGAVPNNLSCPKCQIVFADPREYHEHMMAHSRDNPAATGERPPFWCSICARSFSSAASLKNHVKNHEKQQQQLQQGRSVSPLGVKRSVTPAQQQQIGLTADQQQQQHQPQQQPTATK